MRNSMLACSLVAATSALFGCGTSPYDESYVVQQPTFALFDFFEGNVTAWGIVQNRSGQTVQRFRADINGEIKADTLVLDETFTYFLGDGLKKREWTITQKTPQTYQGEASDIIGKAKGKVSGNALNWQYQMDLPVGGNSYRVKFDDWMWMVDDQTLINRAYIKKFGLVMAEVTLFMQKTAD